MFPGGPLDLKNICVARLGHYWCLRAPPGPPPELARAPDRPPGTPPKNGTTPPGGPKTPPGPQIFGKNALRTPPGSDLAIFEKHYISYGKRYILRWAASRTHFANVPRAFGHPEKGLGGAFLAPRLVFDPPWKS